MAPQAVTAARASSGEVCGKTMCTRVGSVGTAWWTRTKGTSADIAG